MIRAKQEDVANNLDRAAKDLGPKVIKTLLVNEGGQLYLSTDKLRRWLQSLVNKSLSKIQLPNGKVEKVGTKWIFLCPTYNIPRNVLCLLRDFFLLRNCARPDVGGKFGTFEILDKNLS